MNFIEAIQAGNIETVKALLSKNAMLINTPTEQGISPLLLAMYYRKEEVVKVLLENKKVYNYFEAAAAGRLDFLEKHLTVHPDDLNAFAADGFTALGLACFFSKKEIVKYLLQKGANPNIASNNAMQVAPLHSATAVKELELVKLLLENGANVNAAQNNGVTALHSAAHNGAIEIVKVLLENGADTQAKMQDGKTPLDFAVADNFPEIIELLRKE